MEKTKTKQTKVKCPKCDSERNIPIKKWKNLNKSDQENSLIEGAIFSDGGDLIFVSSWAELEGFLLINKKTKKEYAVKKTKKKYRIFWDFLEAFADYSPSKKTKSKGGNCH